ncbi:hypothetical protein ACFX13_040972 [Malus domestica]
MTSYDKQNCRRGCNSMKQWSREESTFSVVQKFGLEDEVEERMERGMTERGADKHRLRKKKGKWGTDGASSGTRPCVQGPRPCVPGLVVGELEVEGVGGRYNLLMGGNEKEKEERIRRRLVTRLCL